MYNNCSIYCRENHVKDSRSTKGDSHNIQRLQPEEALQEVGRWGEDAGRPQPSKSPICPQQTWPSQEEAKFRLSGRRTQERRHAYPSGRAEFGERFPSRRTTTEVDFGAQDTAVESSHPMERSFSALRGHWSETSQSPTEKTPKSRFRRPFAILFCLFATEARGTIQSSSVFTLLWACRLSIYIHPWHVWACPSVDKTPFHEIGGCGILGAHDVTHRQPPTAYEFSDIFAFSARSFHSRKITTLVSDT
jgi:hypothetical protein